MSMAMGLRGVRRVGQALCRLVVGGKQMAVEMPMGGRGGLARASEGAGVRREIAQHFGQTRVLCGYGAAPLHRPALSYAPGSIAARVLGCAGAGSDALSAATGPVGGARGYAKAVPHRGRPKKVKKTKIKTYSSWKKRFRVTGSGKFRRTKEGGLHLKSNKTPTQRRALRQSAMVASGTAKIMRKYGYNWD